MTKTAKKLNKIFYAPAIESYMQTNDICKYAYRLLIDKELPKNICGNSLFSMSISTSGGSFFIRVSYYDSTDKRYKYGVMVAKDYIIPVEKYDYMQVEFYEHMKSRGDISMMSCYESSTKSDAEITVTYFDNLFTKRCREQKVKFSGYGEYGYWRKAYKKFLVETTKNNYNNKNKLFSAGE